MFFSVGMMHLRPQVLDETFRLFVSCGGFPVLRTQRRNFVELRERLQLELPFVRLLASPAAPSIAVFVQGVGVLRLALVCLTTVWNLSTCSGASPPELHTGLRGLTASGVPSRSDCGHWLARRVEWWCRSGEVWIVRKGCVAWRVSCGQERWAHDLLRVVYWSDDQTLVEVRGKC